MRRGPDADRHNAVSSTELTRDAFEARLKELVSGSPETEENSNCLECVGCSGCSHSTFCSGSQSLVRCHYCVQCALCSDCTHCRVSQRLVNCQHCIQSESCTNCAYVVHSLRLTGCSYCFGCVGLSGRDFFILNQPYDSTAYFAVTRRLTKELGL
jgi:hypothetical protein